VLSVVGLLANPWGARVLAYAVLLPTNRVVMGMVSEWAPASLRDPAGAVSLVSVGVLVVAVARSRPQARAPRAAPADGVAGGLGALGGTGWRLVRARAAGRPLHPGEEASAATGRGRPGEPLASSLVLTALVVTMIPATPQVRRALIAGGALRPELSAAPTAAAGWLAENPQAGRMFNYQPWGSYLEFRLGPKVKPAVDSRIELLPAERWRDYLAIAAGRGDAERLLDEWRVG
jgi:hypothetical protein